MRKSLITYVTFALLVFLANSTVLGFPLEVFSEDPGWQDPLWVNGWVHELGNSTVFPEDELIDSAFIEWTDMTACFDGSDKPGFNNALVSITNMTNKSWKDLHYVADPDTFITNMDGFVSASGSADFFGCGAFVIDNIGINRPLVNESINLDLVFQPNETWTFIIQDYVNVLQGPPNAFDSIGVAAASGG